MAIVFIIKRLYSACDMPPDFHLHLIILTAIKPKRHNAAHLIPLCCYPDFAFVSMAIHSTTQ